MQLSPPDRVVYNALLITSYNDAYKPALSPHVIGLGIGAALLAELIAAGTAEIWTHDEADLVTCDPSRSAPTDSLSMWLFEHLKAEPESLSVREWLAYLATDEADVYARVAEHMVLAGYMRRTTSGGRWRRRSSIVFESVDPLITHGPLTLMRFPLQKPHEPLESRRAFLMGLTEAVGLTGALYADITSAGRERAHRAIGALPDSLRILLGHLSAAVAATAMTGGR